MSKIYGLKSYVIHLNKLGICIINVLALKPVLLSNKYLKKIIGIKSKFKVEENLFEIF